MKFSRKTDGVTCAKRLFNEFQQFSLDQDWRLVKTKNQSVLIISIIFSTAEIEQMKWQHIGKFKLSICCDSNTFPFSQRLEGKE